MLTQSSRRLERIANLTSLAVAALFAITTPASYFLVGYSHSRDFLQDQADIAADAISEMVYRDPAFWTYQEHRLADLVTTSNRRTTPRNYVIFDDQNEVVVEIGAALSRPYLEVNAPLSDGERGAGRIVVTESLTPLIKTTLLASLFGALLAWAVHYLLKVLPFATLRRAMDSLAQSRRQLQDEVAAKEQALGKITELYDRMLHQARHDELTGLPNRSFFSEFAERAVARTGQDGRLAILMLDLNRFKEINDSLGHHAGDQVLQEAATRIRDLLREQAFVARLGGDEFAILLPAEQCDRAGDLAATINRTLHHHMVLDSYHIVVQASIGIARYPEHGDSVTMLMRHADIAMYHAKASGDQWCFYDGAFDDNSPSRLTLTADLRKALDCDDLHLLYQPKVRLDDSRAEAVEALLRWNHPEYGFISPDVFIPLAEESGMIHDLSRYVITAAVMQLADWRARGIDIGMSINISARNLQDDGLVDYVKHAAEQHGVAPGGLTLELTESSIMIDPVKAERQIAALSAWGARIAIDDFGTGYSSLAYLKRLQVDELKIDKSFILNMLEDEEDQVIVRSTIDLAHNLGMAVVAEGIENQGAADLLQSYGCELGQGFHYCRPTDAERLEACLLANGNIRAVPMGHG